MYFFISMFLHLLHSLCFIFSVPFCADLQLAVDILLDVNPVRDLD